MLLRTGVRRLVGPLASFELRNRDSSVLEELVLLALPTPSGVFDDSAVARFSEILDDYLRALHEESPISRRLLFPAWKLEGAPLTRTEPALSDFRSGQDFFIAEGAPS